MGEAERPASSADQPTHHLCVLIHGLWGNPQHMAFVASSLRERHPEPTFHILLAKSNSGSFTYDGVERGGERVTFEVEEALDDYARKGQEIMKLSVVGYSLGGLVARYCIGLLYSRGCFDQIEPVNFATFATPHLGVRTPVKGVQQQLWNLIGSRTLSDSGRQLFTIDSFRDTGRPLLSLLADPDSVFIRALAQFKHRVLYTNVVNDRTAAYYTTSISRVDPYTDINAVRVNYVEGYGDIIVDRDCPVSALEEEETPTSFDKVVKRTQDLVTNLPTMAGLALFVPIGCVIYLLNAAVQIARSNQRIRLHEAGQAGIGIASYRIPLMVENVQRAVEGAMQDFHPKEGQTYEPANGHANGSGNGNGKASAPIANGNGNGNGNGSHVKPYSAPAEPTFPTLALSPAQFDMIDTLDSAPVRFTKHPVHIRIRRSHAAIIVREDKEAWYDGKTVIRHWLDKEFEV
ncbi:MAG: hypothetical protein M1838_004595 [Thelocarpon superellum]|nr:MAG: hypothetical protein M1838_004595 [Thelocarpon superellum]